MSVVEISGELVILDLGADIERTKDEVKRFGDMKSGEVVKKKIVPDDSKVKSRREDVVAIIIGHGHLDHCLGIPKLADAYNCPIIATPFTISVIQRLVDDDREDISNELISLEPGESMNISDDIELEFIPVAHSIPQTVLSVLRTCEGTIVYSLDFKFGENPALEAPVGEDELRELGGEGVKALISDCTRTDEPGNAGSEVSVKKKLKKILDRSYEDDEGVMITTFSSHIERLKNIIEANAGRRKVAMLGRSLKEYVKDAEKHSLIDSSNIEITSNQFEVERVLAQASENRSEYLLITTGSQGEPKAVLPRIARNDYPYEFEEDEMVIFSSVTIPTQTDKLNSSLLKRRLRNQGVKIEERVHSHGHAKREDQRELFQLLEPETVIPAHGGKDKQSSCARLAREEKIETRISKNKETISLD
ncbi:hypothetical protein AKJ36_01730 [candidate division MSBL1 archaeon SCGC-AAA259I07]|uniref:Metallo-beta-lactamase domain-containing protein n=1 Tax=candidate division MSBL1 archaeon SCGC-AAA259I07 TaxID=1698266 RepID=A0A133ULE0_9EURY|nr:hypothetical protein AKJ36_01730 [candidate division MSBL1 archaeon SCGC-AAA259I07]